MDFMKKLHLSWKVYVVLGLLLAGGVFVFGDGDLTTRVGKQKSSKGSSTLCSPIPREEFGALPNLVKAQQNTRLLREANQTFSKEFQEYKKTPNETKEQLLKDLAKSRKVHLLETIRSNPDEALSLLLTQEERNTVNSLTSNCVGEFETLEGELEVIHVDFFDEGLSDTRYTLITQSGERIEIHPARGLKDLLESKTEVRIQGYQLDDDLIFDGLSTLGDSGFEGSGIEILSQPGDPLVYGEQKTAVILANFRDSPQPALTPEQIQNVVFTNTNNYYIENSYNQMSLVGDVFGWYSLPIDQTCAWDDGRDAAVNIADSDINFPAYNRIIIIAPFGPDCDWRGFATIGMEWNPFATTDGPIFTSVSIVNSDFADDIPVIAHELGHNFSIFHSRFLDCGSVSIAPTGCISDEYGDLYDVMGGAFNKGHYNAPHKEYIGWFAPSNIQTVTADGTYVIEPIETATEGLKALKIQRSQLDYLYIEYRQPIGFDTNFSLIPDTDIYDGALLHTIGIGGRSRYPILIDVTPPGSATTPTLQPGATFTDPATGTIVTVVSATADNLTIAVVIGQTDFDGPNLSINYPPDGAVLSGIVEIDVTASDASGVDKVEFLWQGNLFATDTLEPFRVNWDTNQVFEGRGWLFVKAYDMLGNLSAQGIWVDIVTNSPPTLTLLDPDVNDDGTVVTGDILFVVGAFGTVEGQEGWNPAYDLNADGTVVMTDVLIAVGAFGTANWPPFNSPTDRINVAQGKPFQLYMRATDPDGNPPTLTASGLPQGATFTTGEGGSQFTRGHFLWTPQESQRGDTYDITFNVSDGTSTVSETLFIEVF